MVEVVKLRTVDELDSLIEKSHQAPVMIFKHSLICPISAAAYGEFESYLAARPAGDRVVHALVEIQRARPVSNAVAERTGVRHESPQALVLRGGRVVWHQSHGALRVASLSGAVES
ncbi:MAG TPA: bacillithiol system redox-active protein YtxJ [Thermoanaerobaculia bacterium]|jgi:bacillithiol system protein YtxJ